MTTNAFTCTGPYAILIMLGIKRTENRHSIPSPEKGRCAVSVSKSFCKEEYGTFIQWASLALPPEDFARVPAWNDVQEWPGKIVGCVDYALRRRTDQRAGRPLSQWSGAPTGRMPVVPVEPWDEGYPYWWDLSEVVCFDEPIPCRGNVGMWQMPDDLARIVSTADDVSRLADFQVQTPDDAARLFRGALPMVGDNEGFFVLPLDETGHPKSMPALVSLGTSAASIRLQDVFAEVFKAGATRFIVAHNHPGGSLTPSADDIKLTQSIKAAADLLGVQFLGHLILGAETDFANIQV